MKKKAPEFLVPGIFFAFALLFAVVLGVRAQTSPHAGHGPEASDTHAEMKAECQAMMAKKKAIEDQRQVMDATLDKLVAEMNAAKGPKEVGAMELAIAAVINELVAQRKASRSLDHEKEPTMMAHMGHHMDKHGKKGGMAGAMDCPMMKAHHDHAAEAEAGKPKP